jgi:hypothetical protein
VNNQSVERGGLSDAGHRWVVKMLLLVLAGLGVLMTEDEMNLNKLIRVNRFLRNVVTNLVGSTALVRAKHDDVWGGVREFLLVELLVLL